MNKVLFHEGGQPLYLDDLALLQANVLENQRILLSALTGQNIRACFVAKPVFVGVRGEDGVTFSIPAGHLIVDGEVIAYAPTELKTSSAEAILYIGIARRDTDVRIFEDGQLRPCRQEVRAVWTHSPEGFDEVFKYADLPSLTSVVTRTQEDDTVTSGDDNAYRDVPVYWWGNGNLTGSVKMRSVDNRVHVRVEVRAYNASLPASSGEMFSFLEDTDAALVNGYVTNHFTLNGQEYAFVFHTNRAYLVAVVRELHRSDVYSYHRLSGNENLPPDLLQELTLKAKVGYNMHENRYTTDNQSTQ